MNEATVNHDRHTDKNGAVYERVSVLSLKPDQPRWYEWHGERSTPLGRDELHTIHPTKSNYPSAAWVEVLPAPKELTVEKMAAKQATGKVPPPLPTEDKDRKALPVFTGPLMYFPHALLAVAAVCKAGNDQHNPGQPMHWAREKSTDQMNTALRHMMDHGLGNTKDTDGTYHLAKAAWRILAELQLTVEKDLAAKGT